MSIIWALTDNRAGHTAHTLGIADLFQMPFEQKPLTYNPKAILPDWLLSPSLSTLKDSSREAIGPPWPNIAIASGRRMVPIMRYIKQQSPETILIQCLWPERLEPFDIIFAPEHDRTPDDSRIIRFKGALHNLTQTQLQDARITFQALFDQYPKPHFGLLIGGHSSSAKASISNLHHLIDTAELLVGDGTLFITTSRRTPASFAGAIKDRLTCHYYLYDWRSHQPNPYHAFLALSDILIVSGDSISMMSEACATDAPVLIDTFFDSMRPKHHACCASLIEAGHAYTLQANLDIASLIANPLHQREKLSRELKERLKDVLNHTT